MTTTPFYAQIIYPALKNVEKGVIVLRLAIDDYRLISFSKEIPAVNV